MYQSYGLGKSTNGIDLGQYKSSNNYKQLWTITTLSNTSKKAISPASADEIENQQAKYQIALYPNPSTTFNLKVEDPAVINEILIFDLSGRQVEHIEHSEITSLMPIGSSLKPNMYIAPVSGKAGTKFFKIVKM
ncbi:MAG: T9SS type A sorting domain-containing protein [Flavobacterium sp.]